MLVRYVVADLLRNPRRTVWTAVGVSLGVGLFCAVLFFVDGLSASMTQRAIAPLPIDMQLVFSEPIAGNVQLTQVLTPVGPAQPGDHIEVRLELTNREAVPMNEVTVRSVPGPGLVYSVGSASVGDRAVAAGTDNPFASGPARAGFNIGTVEPGTTVVIVYQATVLVAGHITGESIASTLSTREALFPMAANAADQASPVDLAAQIRALPGIAFAEQLSFADLPPMALHGGKGAGTVDGGPVRLFAFDARYIERDSTIKVIEGMQQTGAAMISAEAASALSVGVGDSISLDLPDGSQLSAPISGIVDLARARSLFASRRGADLETFIYRPNAVILDPALFAEIVRPAYARAASDGGERLKSPPVREIDIGIERELLDAEPVVALEQTQRIATAIIGIAGVGGNFLLDNLSNTLAVARADAAVAKGMFVFLGAPGAMLAAMLAGYAGIVLGGAQRRERAILRIRGASKRHLLSILALRVGSITLAGASVGVVLGYFSASIVLGHTTLSRATTGSLAVSAVLGTLMGFFVTGAALYLTGRRSIHREINEDRAQLWTRPPVWRRYGLDMAGLAVVVAATAIVVATSGFEGTPGSVYVGRAVELPLGLLVLPIGAWLAGSLLGGRIFALLLARPGARSSTDLDRPFTLLYRMSLKRRSWFLADVAIILGLIVALGTCLAVFTASYEGAKAADARYVVGSDIKVTPSPGAEPALLGSSAEEFMVEGVGSVSAVVYAVHNAVLRSDRTSEVANLAALDPQAYARVAPLENEDFSSESADAAIAMLAKRFDAILLNREMASFLQAEVGTTVGVLLARGTSEQVEIRMEIVGLFERLPGFPDGVDALMNIAQHETMVPSSVPAFFLARTAGSSEAALRQTVANLYRDPGAGGALQIDTRLTALAKDQSSLAALNIGGLLVLDSAYSLAMGAAAIAIFVFGLLLQRRREYVTMRAMGMQPRSIRSLITAEAVTAAVAGCLVGIPVGLAMAYYLTNVLRPLFVLDPPYLVPLGSLGTIVGSVLAAAAVASVAASSLVNRLRATELLRDE